MKQEFQKICYLDDPKFPKDKEKTKDGRFITVIIILAFQKRLNPWKWK